MEKSEQGNTFVDVMFRSGLTPGANYTSGLTVYDESLIDGRLIGRYWSSVGFKKPEKDISKDIAVTYALSLQAFDLEMDGQALHFGWKWVKAYEEDSGSTDIRHAVIELSHKVRPVNIKVHTRLDGTPFIIRWIEVTNTSDKPSALSSISPWAGLIWHTPNHRHPFSVVGAREFVSNGNDSVFSMGSFIKRIWGTEGDFDWQSLPNGTLRLEGIEGRSGHGCPFFIVRNEGTGEFFIGHLAWSGNWRIEFTCNQDKGKGDEQLFFKIGPYSPGPMRVLTPGETIKSPEVHLGLIQGDLDRCVQNLHNHIRCSVLPPQPEGRAQRIIYNHWGYMDDEVSEDFLKQEIDIAAEIGCELFEVDAGWFGDKNIGWGDTVGDWHTGNRLPNGLEPVFQYARKKGLLYGLWVEPERIGMASKIYKKHPDWVITRYGVPGNGELDLTKPEVASWVESEIVRLIRHYDLDLFRLDYNVSVFEGGQRSHEGFLENTIWRHYEVIYGIFDRLQKEFPKLLIENCSSGGGRNDLGMVSRSHTGWLSDWMVQPRSLKILNGMTIALPPEYCNRMAGALMSAYLKADLDFQLRVPLFGHWSISGVSPSIKEINPIVKERITHHIKLYKDFIRPMLPTCRVFHHTPVLKSLEPEGWCVLEYASSDASRIIAGIFRLVGNGDEEYLFRPRGLDVSRQYKVTFDNKGKSIKGEGVELEQKGLVVRLGKPLTSELLLFEST